MKRPNVGGKVIRVRVGQVMILDGNAVKVHKAERNVVELYILGRGEIIEPQHTREFGPFESREDLERLLEYAGE